MSKPIQAVTFPEPSPKITEDASAPQNGDTEAGVPFVDLLTGEESAAAPPAQEQAQAPAQAGDAAAEGSQPNVAAGPDTGADEPATPALSTLQLQLAETAAALAEAAQPARSDPRTPAAEASQSVQLPLPGIQTGQAGSPGAATEPGAAALQAATGGSGLPQEAAGPEEQRPQVAIPRANLQPEAGLSPEQTGVQAARVLPALPAQVADPAPERYLPEPVATTARDGLQALAAAMNNQGGAKQLLSDGRNAALTLPDNGAAVSRAEPGMTEFAASLADTDVRQVTSRVPVPVGQPGWGRAVGEQVVWYVSQNINAASLRLNPQHLGPLEMQVSLDGTQANVTFTAQNAMVRDALESALPRLRDMLAENGLNLANVNVSQHNSPEQRDAHAHGSPQAGNASMTAGSDPDADAGSALPSQAILPGLVDTYA